MNAPRIRTTEEFDSGDMVVDGDHFERHIVRMSPGFKKEFAWVEKEFQIKMAQSILIDARSTAVAHLPDDETLFERTYFISHDFVIELRGEEYKIGVVMSVECTRTLIKTGKRRGEEISTAKFTGCICMRHEKDTIYNQLSEGIVPTVQYDSQERRN